VRTVFFGFTAAVAAAAVAAAVAAVAAAAAACDDVHFAETCALDERHTEQHEQRQRAVHKEEHAMCPRHVVFHKVVGRCCGDGHREHGSHRDDKEIVRKEAMRVAAATVCHNNTVVLCLLFPFTFSLCVCVCVCVVGLMCCFAFAACFALFSTFGFDGETAIDHPDG
jgi:hypothetical protein